MAQRAERLKAFNAVFRPFYESLNDEQKAIAGVVLRSGHHGGHRWAHRWTMGRGTPPAQQ